MQRGQLIIRTAVFCCVAFVPSGDGSEILIAIVLGLLIGIINMKIKKVFEDDRSTQN